MKKYQILLVFIVSFSFGYGQRYNVTELSTSENKYTLNGAFYSGKVYSLTKKAQLKEEFTIENGMLNGLYELYKIDDNYTHSKYKDTLLISRTIKNIEELELKIKELQKDSIRKLDSVWIQEEELLGGRVFKQTESVEVLKRKEKLKSIEEKYANDKLNEKKKIEYDNYVESQKEFTSCLAVLIIQRSELKQKNEALNLERGKPMYQNTLSESYYYVLGNQTGIHSVYDKNGNKEIEKTLYNGKKEGSYKKYSGSKIIEQGNYLNNEKEGEWITQNNSEKITQNYTNGKLNGPYKKYDGEVLLEEGAYVDGLMNGEWKFYFNSGKLKGAGKYINGDGSDLGGQSRIPKNGRDGNWVLYYENGNKEQEFTYQSGLLEGVVITYHDNGNVSTRCNYINGKPEGECFHFYNGGQKQYNILYLNGAKEGVFTEYFENGKIKRTGQHKNNKLHGSFKNYSDNGNLILEYEMKEGVSEFEGNIQIEYNENGEFSRKFKYNNGTWERSLTPEEADKKLKEYSENQDKIVSCSWCGRKYRFGDGYSRCIYGPNKTCLCGWSGGGDFCSEKCTVEECEHR